MIGRCENSRSPDFALYGGRGIRICQRWRNDFTAFLTDMGPRPSPKHSIDRVDSNGNYEPGNCRWATPTEQARNTSRNVRLTVDGVTGCVAELADARGLRRSTVYGRLRRGTSPEHALQTGKTR
jgi:hypothetical protein